jgi:predicted HTH domain antitoxin
LDVFLSKLDNVITIPYTSDILVSLGLSQDELTMLAKLAVSALFSDGKLSFGKAAEFCGLGKVEFMEKLSLHGYSTVNLQLEDADDEIHFAHGR